MGAIANLFGYLLNFLYNIFNNYGIAIIVFSVILRIILIPVTISQQKSIKKNEKMQEKMKEIQRKYKNNPEKLNQEMQMLCEHKEELNIIAAFRYGNLISVDVLGMPSNERKVCRTYKNMLRMQKMLQQHL